MTNSKSARGVQKISLSSIAKILQHIYYSIDSTQFQWIDVPGALELRSWHAQPLLRISLLPAPREMEGVVQTLTFFIF